MDASRSFSMSLTFLLFFLKVGVAVCNYKVPVCESKEDVMANCHRIASFIDGAKLAYPGLDFIIFPEYTTQGFHPSKWRDLTTTLDGPEVAVFKESCKKNKASLLTILHVLLPHP
jgi:amidase